MNFPLYGFFKGKTNNHNFWSFEKQEIYYVSSKSTSYNRKSSCTAKIRLQLYTQQTIGDPPKHLLFYVAAVPSLETSFLSLLSGTSSHKIEKLSHCTLYKAPVKRTPEHWETWPQVLSASLSQLKTQTPFCNWNAQKGTRFQILSTAGKHFSLICIKTLYAPVETLPMCIPGRGKKLVLHILFLFCFPETALQFVQNWKSAK